MERKGGLQRMQRLVSFSPLFSFKNDPQFWWYLDIPTSRPMLHSFQLPELRHGHSYLAVCRERRRLAGRMPPKAASPAKRIAETALLRNPRGIGFAVPPGRRRSQQTAD